MTRASTGLSIFDALLVLIAFVGVVSFPWPLAAAIALVGSFTVPFLPLAAGIFAEALYHAPHAAVLPYATFLGAVATVLALAVRSQLKTGIIRG